MSKFVRLVDHGIEGILVIEAKDISHGSDKFQHCSLDTFRNGELNGVFVGLPEKFPQGFIGIETFDGGKDIVLHAGESRTSDLRCKVIGLVFAEPEQSLAFLEDNLNGPSPGIDAVSLKEVKPEVGRHKSAPRPVLTPADEEQPHLDTGKDDLRTCMLAPELTAVLDLLAFLECPDNGRGIDILPFETIFGPALLSNLDHAQIITAYVLGNYEVDDRGAGESVVNQLVAEPDSMLDGAPDHLYGEVGLLLRVLAESFLQGIVEISIVYLVVPHKEVLIYKGTIFC